MVIAIVGEMRHAQIDRHYRRRPDHGVVDLVGEQGLYDRGAILNEQRLDSHTGLGEIVRFAGDPQRCLRQAEAGRRRLCELLAVGSEDGGWQIEDDDDGAKYWDMLINRRVLRRVNCCHREATTNTKFGHHLAKSSCLRSESILSRLITVLLNCEIVI